MRFETHPLSLRQLQYVLAVAETRSFRRAAELCHVAQPSLSAQIAALEDAIGMRLFERNQRRVLLTAAGEEIVARARRVLLAADDLVEATKRYTDPLARTIRVGVIPTISPYLLPEIVPALRKQHPKLGVLWTEDKTEVLVASVQAGSLDGALLALEADLGDLERDVVAKDPFVLAAPAEHPLADGRRPARLAELHGASVLLLDDGHCLRDQALEVCARARAHELDYRATSLATLVQMVSAGAGVTLLPRLALPTEARRASIAVRRFTDPAPHRTLAFVWRRSTALETALRALTATTRDAYRRLEPRLDRALA